MTTSVYPDLHVEDCCVEKPCQVTS